MNSDYIILAPIYLGILSDRQCGIVYDYISELKRNYIPGTMTIGHAFWYTHENILEQYMRDELFFIDNKDYILYPMIIVFLSRIILINEGV